MREEEGELVGLLIEKAFECPTHGASLVDSVAVKVDAVERAEQRWLDAHDFDQPLGDGFAIWHISAEMPVEGDVADASWLERFDEIPEFIGSSREGPARRAGAIVIEQDPDMAGFGRHLLGGERLGGLAFEKSS